MSHQLRSAQLLSTWLLDAGNDSRTKKRRKGSGGQGDSRAAAAAVQSRDVEGVSARFRDGEFFISPTQAGSQAAAAFAVHERTSGAQGAMDAAVLDLLADDQACGPRLARHWHSACDGMIAGHALFVKWGSGWSRSS